jgi:hypothetical protein
MSKNLASESELHALGMRTLDEHFGGVRPEQRGSVLFQHTARETTYRDGEPYRYVTVSTLKARRSAIIAFGNAILRAAKGKAPLDVARVAEDWVWKQSREGGIEPVRTHRYEE